MNSRMLVYVVISVGSVLLVLTSVNLYLGRTDFLEKGWIHLGLGALFLFWGIKNLKKK